MSVPKLRFKDEKGSEFPLWEEANLLSLDKNESFTNGVFNDPAKVGRGYKLINVLNMYTDGTIDDNSLNLVDIDKSEFFKNKVFHGDVFFTRSSLVKEGIAHSNVYLGFSDDVTFDGHLIKLSPNTKKVSPVFLNFLLKKSYVRKQLVSRGKTATMTTIGQKDIASVVVRVPALSEQTKIANFLTTIDDYINQLTRKHELLTQYKKAAMQQIFSQQLRFKDENGEDFADWEEKNILDIAKDKNLTNGVFNDPTKVGKGYKLINVLNMYTDGTIADDSLNLVDIDKKEFLRNKVFYGDIFFTRSSLVKEGIAHSNVYLGSSDDVTFDGHLIKLSPNQDQVNPVFLNFLLKMSYVRQQLVARGKTATMTTIGQKDIAEVEIKIPVLAEQTKIANFLTQLDQQLDQLQQQINQIKQYKQGLLQQMFV